MWRIAANGGVEQPDGSFLDQCPHTLDPIQHPFHRSYLPFQNFESAYGDTAVQVNYPDRYRTTGPPRTVDRLGFCRNHFVRPVGLHSSTYRRPPPVESAATSLPFGE